MRKSFLLLIISTSACVSLLFALNTAYAQDYLSSTGAPTFAMPEPVELGYINLANGNLHLELPVGAFQQRGKIGFTAKLVYDSRIWQVVSNAWQPTNVANSQGGWRFVATVDPGSVTQSTTTSSCSGGTLTTYNNFVWTDPNGTRRYFPIQTSQNTCTGVNTSSGDAFATDSSGFHMYVTNYTSAAIFAKNGNQVSPSSKDTNGNYFSTDGNGNVIDTLGRTPVKKTVNGNQTYYDVLNSQGASSRYTVTTTTINANTSFAQSGVSEYAGTITVFQSIALPDGSSYSFNYDSGTTPGNFGELTNATLRTGGQVSYGYTTFADSYGNNNRWVNQRTSAGGTWTYVPQVVTTCSQGTVGCQQQVKVSKPSGDDAVYTFTLNNGAWDNQVQSYTGPASGGTLLSTVATDFDFSNACALAGCFGNNYVRPIRVTVTDPIPGANVSKKTEYAYDSIYYGNVTAAKEWNYYSSTPSSSPDRETDFTYLSTSAYTTKDILDAVTSVSVKNGAGAQLSQTNTTYDSASLTSVTGIAHHDDTNYGTGNTVRGEATSLQKWVSGSTYLITGYSYDTTGQVLQVTNPRGLIRSYSYADNFYTDNGANPPAAFTPATPTNAFVTKITLVNIGSSATLQYGYYFNSSKLARDKDANLSDIYHHYQDSLDRETHVYDRKLINGTRGWTLTTYTSPTQTDVYRGITTTTPSTSCTSCRHDTITYDGNGRKTRSALASDPDGQTYLDTVYDSSDRQQSVSNPYRTTSDPTYGIESMQYDGMDRAIKQTHADNNARQVVYGAAVSSSGGAASQLCSASSYGLGYPTLSLDEAGKKKQIWNDGFGRNIEADEPDSSNNLTIATCYQYDPLDNLLQVSQGTQTRTYTYDGLSRQTSAAEPESGTTHSNYTASNGSVCSGSEKDVCRSTDARNITTTYIYDNIDRLDTIQYSDSTPPANYYYDQSSYNGLSISYGGNRRTGMSDGSGQTAWSYDPFGHVITERRTIAGITKNTNYTYNLDGSTATIQYPSGRTITYAYSNAQRTVSAVDSANNINYAKSATYAPQGALASLVHGQVNSGFAGITRSDSYNNRLQPANMQASSANGTVLSLSYNFVDSGNTNNGNAASIANNLNVGRTQSFTYDTLNRLSSAQSQATSGTDCWGQSFSYDRYGNLLTTNVTKCSAQSMSTTVNGNNQITNAGFAYDAAGNLTSDGSLTYAWDGEKRLQSAAGVNYTYDGDNWRTKKSSGELEWHDSFCNHGLITESDLSGNPTEEYIFFNGSRIARRDASGAVYYYFGDRLNSGRVMTNASGVTQQESEYYPFGYERVITNNVDNRHKFTGKKRDMESGLDYSHFRMLSSSVGRWASTDPEMGDLDAPQTLNRYGYVANNPVNLLDPQGAFIVARSANIFSGGGGGGGYTLSVTVWAPVPQPDPFPPSFFFPSPFPTLPQPFFPNLGGGGGGGSRPQPPAPKPQPKPQPKPAGPPTPKSECSAYHQCLKGAYKHISAGHLPHIPPQRWDTGNDNFGDAAFPPLFSNSDPESFLIQSIEENCLAKYPLAALQPGCGTPNPGDVFVK